MVGDEVEDDDNGSWGTADISDIIREAQELDSD
jgi:hypothetical protein